MLGFTPLSTVPISATDDTVEYVVYFFINGEVWIIDCIANTWLLNKCSSNTWVL